MHIDTDLFVVAVDAGPVRGFASHARAAQPGEDRGDDLIAEGEQGGDRACGGCPDVVAAASAGFVDELFAPQLAQVVAGLADGVAAVIGAGEGVHLGGEIGDGEAAGRAIARASTAARAARMRVLLTSTPPTLTLPLETSKRRGMRPRRVVLPEPVEPMIAVRWPGSARNEMPWSTDRSAPG